MKKLIISSLLLFAPVSLYATNTPDIEKLGKAMKINCKDVGEDSCFARFISLWVSPAIAETTTTTLTPELIELTTRSATAWNLSVFATDVPPYFWTIKLFIFRNFLCDF